MLQETINWKHDDKTIPIRFSIFNISGGFIADNQLKNGNYYQNGKFKTYSSIYVVNGSFTFKKPKTIDTIIHLYNKYILPPLAEGHTHKLDKREELKRDIDTFVKQGVFIPPQSLPQGTLRLCSVSFLSNLYLPSPYNVWPHINPAPPLYKTKPNYVYNLPGFPPIARFLYTGSRAYNPISEWSFLR